MVIEINKNIDNYKESVVLGLSARQLVYSVLSVAAGGGIVLLLYRHVGLTVSTYIAIPVVAPIAMTGFYSYHGMTFLEMMKLKMHFAFANRTLVLCQEKVQVKSELFLQHSIPLILPILPSFLISAHTHSRIRLVIDIHNDCVFGLYCKMSLCIQIPVCVHAHSLIF